MTYRLLLLWALLLLRSFSASAQVFEPAFLIRSTGDTLRGEIENSFWEEPPKIIRYRRTVADTVETFRPRQLRAVSFVNGRQFRYMGLPIDQAAETRFQRLTRGYRPDIRTDSVLADVLVDGAVSLVRVVTPGSPHYLLLRAGRPVLDLYERQYFAQQPGQSRSVVKVNNYKSQLSLYLANCPLATGAAQKARFTAEELAAVVQAYNTSCDSTQQPSINWLAATKPTRSTAFQGGLVVGGNYSTTAYVQGRHTVRPFAGLYSDLLLPNRKFMLYAELNASAYSDTLRYPSSSSPSVQSSYRIWLATVRLGAHYVIALPHDQQLLLGLHYEISKVVGVSGTSASNPPVSNLARRFEPIPLALPSLGLGWRKHRFSVGLYGQVYPGGDAALSVIGSSNLGVRLNLGYRLGRHPDAAPGPAPTR